MHSLARTLNSARTRGYVYQALILGGVAVVGWFLVSNTLDNLERRGVATGFAFLSREASFEIGESLIPFSAADTYLRAFIVGLLNTLTVSAVGVLLASVLGLAVGVARLSSNWIVSRMAAAFVEIVRNIPLLLQLIVWYTVIGKLPGPRDALEPLPDVFLTNRGLKLPWPQEDPAHAFILAAAAVGVVAAFVVARWARRRRETTGQRFPTSYAVAGLALGLPGLVFFASGMPLVWDIPRLQGFNFAGGVTITPEFAALLVGLSVYTAGFIAEIVRSGILSVPHGQTEAGLALGLKPGQILRLIILPQALRVIVPPLTSQYLNLTKNSSLAVAIGYPDLVSISNTTANQTGQVIEMVSMMMAVYLVVSLAISAFMNWRNQRAALVTR